MNYVKKAICALTLVTLLSVTMFGSFTFIVKADEYGWKCPPKENCNPMVPCSWSMAKNTYVCGYIPSQSGMTCSEENCQEVPWGE
jgi:hypothetical protein